MSIVSRQAAWALKHCRKLNSGNTKVTIEDGAAVMRLHGNPIARHDPSAGTLAMSMCGWGTVTTRARLNAVCREFRLGEFGFRQRRGVQFYGPRAIDTRDVVRVDLKANQGAITTEAGAPVRPAQTPEQAAQIPLFA